VDVYLQCGAIFETGLARVELARTLLSLNRPDAALLSAQRAHDDLQKIGAASLAGRATGLIAEATAVSH
jgi:hypothetical protein